MAAGIPLALTHHQAQPRYFRLKCILDSEVEQGSKLFHQLRKNLLEDFKVRMLILKIAVTDRIDCIFVA
jgi:hypothetical protein